MWSSKSESAAQGLLPFRSVGALFLTVVCPIVVMFVVRWGAPGADSKAWSHLRYNYAGHGGNLASAVEAMVADPVAEFTALVLPVECDGERKWEDCNDKGMAEAAAALFTFMALQLVLMRVLPGSVFEGPRSAGGHVPKYITNGVASYAISMLAFVFAGHEGYIEGDIVMQLYPFMVIVLNLFALIFCAFLVVKGLTCPSHEGRDASSSGNYVMDFYWGTELYPEIFGIDVKTFTNCRFGMTAWATALLSFAFFNVKLNGGHLHLDSAAAMILTVFYLGKFFVWEHGYWRSMDIAHDRAGFYICWGCLVWVQTIYVSAGYFYAWQPVDSFVATFGEEHAQLAFYALLAVGVAAVYLNYEADRQRMHARSSTGMGSAWGSRFACIKADYTTDDGSKHTSLLLASHLWKPARHFHYVFEISAAVAWCIPFTLGTVFPNIYWGFLTILLFDRAVRDNARCKAKYGEGWDHYCKAVPYLVVPFVF